MPADHDCGPVVRTATSPTGTTRQWYGDGCSTISFTAETAELFDAYLAEASEIFEAQFGRPMGPDDPLFFDFDAPEPRALTEEQINHILIGSLQGVGADPAHIWAAAKSGVLVTEENHDLVDPDALVQWYAEMALFDCLSTDAEATRSELMSMFRVLSREILHCSTPAADLWDWAYDSFGPAVLRTFIEASAAFVDSQTNNAYGIDSAVGLESMRLTGVWLEEHLGAEIDWSEPSPFTELAAEPHIAKLVPVVWATHLLMLRPQSHTALRTALDQVTDISADDRAPVTWAA